MQHTAYQQQIAGPVVIDRVETMLVDLPTIRPHKLSMATMNGQTLMLVRVRCSDGTTGIGEGTTIGGLAYGGESPEGMKLAIDTYFAREVLPHVPDAWIDERLFTYTATFNVSFWKELILNTPASSCTSAFFE